MHSSMFQVRLLCSFGAWGHRGIEVDEWFKQQGTIIVSSTDFASFSHWIHCVHLMYPTSIKFDELLVGVLNNVLDFVLYWESYDPPQSITSTSTINLFDTAINPEVGPNIDLTTKNKTRACLWYSAIGSNLVGQTVSWVAQHNELSSVIAPCRHSSEAVATFRLHRPSSGSRPVMCFWACRLSCWFDCPNHHNSCRWRWYISRKQCEKSPQWEIAWMALFLSRAGKVCELNQN